MRALIFAFLLLGLCVATGSESSSEAEATTKRFAESLARFDVTPMVDEFHSEVHQFCYTMTLHIIETTSDKTERSDLLKGLRVTNLDEFKKLTPKVATIRLYEVALSGVPKQAREASLHAKISIVGSIVEKDYVHVLYRSEADFKDLSMSVNVPSVVTLKRDGDRLKVASTTQFETMKAKLKAQKNGK